MIHNYDDFKQYILRISTVDLNAYKEKQMKRRIESLISRRGFKGYNDFSIALKTDSKLFKDFMSYITINVSEFYRNPNQWTVLKDTILPQYIQKHQSSINIWSAACSTGQEPYSLVMMLSKFMPLTSIKIIATDIDEQVLAKAKNGIYDFKSIEGIPSTDINKFFIKDKTGMYKIKNEIKKCITFKKHNLLKDIYPNNLDLIICRNVLIYFTEDAKSNIYHKFNQSLKKDGILFVGSTEQIINSAKFNFEPIRTFFYKKVN